jgi:hypothetical protein
MNELQLMALFCAIDDVRKAFPQGIYDSATGWQAPPPATDSAVSEREHDDSRQFPRQTFPDVQTLLYRAWGTPAATGFSAAGQLHSPSEHEKQRKQALIETSNDEVKNVSQIEHTQHRSVTEFRVNLVASLVAYSYQYALCSEPELTLG